MEDYKISIREIQRMIFVSNALNDGWTVRRVGYEKYEFIKDNETYQRDISNHATLDDFLKSNSSISKFLKSKQRSEGASDASSISIASIATTGSSSTKIEKGEKGSSAGKEREKEKEKEKERDRKSKE